MRFDTLGSSDSEKNIQFFNSCSNGRELFQNSFGWIYQRVDNLLVVHIIGDYLLCLYGFGERVKLLTEV